MGRRLALNGSNVVVIVSYAGPSQVILFGVNSPQNWSNSLEFIGHDILLTWILLAVIRGDKSYKTLLLDTIVG